MIEAMIALTALLIFVLLWVYLDNRRTKQKQAH